MDFHHFMIWYTVWRTKCILLCQENDIEIGSWPDKVRQMLGSRKVISAVLEFLPTTMADKGPSVMDLE